MTSMSASAAARDLLEKAEDEQDGVIRATAFTLCRRSPTHAFDAWSNRCLSLSMRYGGWLKAEGAGDDWKMEVLGAPLRSGVAMAPTSALGACPQSRPKR